MIKFVESMNHKVDCNSCKALCEDHSKDCGYKHSGGIINDHGLFYTYFDRYTGEEFTIDKYGNKILYKKG